MNLLKTPIAQTVNLSGLLFLIVLSVYWPVTSYSFLNFDDNIYVTQNPHVNSGLTWANVVWAFSDFRGGHWHPLTWVSHMIDVELFGLEPGSHHLVNVLIHALNGVVLFLILTNFWPTFGYPFVLALLFALHPMRIESVAWVSERKDVLSGFFGLSTIFAYFKYSERRTFVRYLLVLGLLALGLLAKPTLVVVPFLLLLLDLWPLRRFSFDSTKEHRYLLVRCFAEKIPLLLLAIASSLVTLISQHSEGALGRISLDGLADRVSNALVSYLAYLGKFFFPTGLGIFYPLETYPPGVGVGAFVALIIISAVCVINFKRWPFITFGWLFFLIAPLPVIGFIQFGGQAFADRWTYLSHIGLLIGVGSLVSVYLTNLRIVKIILAFGLIGVSILWTRIELPNWRDSISIFSHTLKVSPNNFMAHTNLGSALDNAGRLDEAAFHYEEAIRLRPHYPEALNNLGSLRVRRGDLVQGITLFKRALDIRPDFEVARHNLDLALKELGRRAAN